jgi:GTP-binding protein
MPLVAIIGRPNVGKSTFFNRLVGTRKAIVGDEPGITRDRMYGTVNWEDKTFSLVDTGGIVPDDEAIIPANIFKQASVAISEAQALVWVVDARAGITPLDEELAIHLRNTGKRVIVAANKVESNKVEAEAGEFHQFGFDIFPVSSEHGSGIGDLLDELTAALEFPTEEEEEKDRAIRVAIIGRPNVGKSSLLNKLLGEERVIVSPIAGTTRDAIDTELTVDGKRFLLIDTAGIRRKGKTTEMAEKLSVIMARKSLERADVAVILIDAEEGVTHLDATIAGYAVDEGCSIIIAVNKWDVLENKETNTAHYYEKDMREKLKFLEFAPVVTISALSGQRVTKILPLAAQAREARNQRIPTAKLNAFFERNVKQPQGSTAPGRGTAARLHVQYMTQAGVRPPTFVIFTSGGGKAGLHFSYLRYIENRLREEFEFFASPIKLIERHKSRKKKK